MKVLSFILIFCFTAQAALASSRYQQLEQTLDSYHYDLTVDWDQKDPERLKILTKNFYLDLEELMKAGLKMEEVTNLVVHRLKNPQLVEFYRSQVESISRQANSANELANFLTKHHHELYHRGASWNGSVIMTVGISLTVAALLGYAIWFDVNHTCVAWAQGQQCGWVSAYWGGPQYYDCWPATYCTDYRKN